MRKRNAANARDVGGIVYGDGLGVFVLDMMLLCVNLFVLFEVLWTLERLFANLQRVSG